MYYVKLQRAEENETVVMSDEEGTEGLKYDITKSYYYQYDSVLSWLDFSYSNYKICWSLMDG